jgi:hypothetical protein
MQFLLFLDAGSGGSQLGKQHFLQKNIMKHERKENVNYPTFGFKIG